MRWLLFVILFIAAPGWAQERIDLAGRMALLRDASLQLTFDAIQRSTDFQTLPGNMNVGFTQDAVWLRVNLSGLPAVAGRILEISHPYHDDLRLYTRQGDGAWRERRGGEDVPIAEREFVSRQPAFVLDEYEASDVFYLRIQSHNSIQTSLHLWTHDAFERTAQQETLIYGLFFGIYLAVMLSHLFFWRWTREAVSGWYVVYVVLSLLNVVISAGYFQQYVDWRSEVIDRVLALDICLLIWSATRFALLQLELTTVMPRLERYWRHGTTLVTGISLTLALSVSYAAGVVPMQVLTLISATGLLAVSLWLWWRGHPPAAFFFVAFGALFIGSILRYLSTLGFLLADQLNVYGYQIGAATHMILMSLAITSRYNTLKREKELAQAEAIAAKSTLAGRLEEEVAARTRSLVAEIARREALEEDLRRALTVEQQARQEQRDFVAMVSHEFRTPLAIINTSVQQLAANLDAPGAKSMTRCTNIREAARRMTDLMDEYLSLDRMDGDALPLQLAVCDVRALIDRVVAEWPERRIEVRVDEAPATQRCDERLLQIALRNLVANALRHSPGDAPVYIQLRPAQEGGTVIDVINHGDGISDDEISRLFQKYFRGRNAQQKPGAGLGLYLVERIAHLHDGHIEVASNPGQGSCFTLRLPSGANSGPCQPACAGTVNSQ